jgi:hypothetical protein
MVRKLNEKQFSSPVITIRHAKAILCLQIGVFFTRARESLQSSAGIHIALVLLLLLLLLFKNLPLQQGSHAHIQFDFLLLQQGSSAHSCMQFGIRPLHCITVTAERLDAV